MRKTNYITVIATAFLISAATSSAAELAEPLAASRLIAERELFRSEHQIVGESVVAVPTAGGTERIETNRWVRLAAGMQFRDAGGTLRETKEEIVTSRDAARATQ